MVYPGSILSGVNIQFKGFNPISSIPKLYTTEQSLFTTNPKTDYILNIFNDYKMFMKMPEVRRIRNLVFLFHYVIILYSCISTYV